MSKTIKYLTYSDKLAKSKIKSECNKYAYDNGSYAQELPNEIRFIDEIFGNEIMAMSYLSRVDRGDYDQVAVKYRLPFDENSLTSTKLSEYTNKYNKVCERYKKAKEYTFIPQANSQYTTCKRCGSKLNVKYIKDNKGNKCPVCKADMSPERVKAKLSEYKNKMDALDKLITKELERLKVKAIKNNTRWLVKIEYWE